MSEKKYQHIKVEKLSDSKVKISGEITEKAFGAVHQEALSHTKEHTEVPGFRVGKAPETIVVKHVGEMKILERAAEAAINDVYTDILKEHAIRAIGMPFISITKIAVGNPLGFSIETAVMPEISLNNYKKLASEATQKITEAPNTVEDKEVDEVIDDIRKRLVPADSESKELPELNTEFVKKFGDFADVEAFKTKIKENILEQKKRETKDKKRAAIADRLIDEAKFEVPEIIVESELDTMMNQFRNDVERSGHTLEGYLKHIKKEEKEIRHEWREGALRRAKLELILKHIARAEKIIPDESEMKEKMDHILSHHKEADRFQVRMYIENILTNEKVFEFLEK